jgi:hypothetical protein
MPGESGPRPDQEGFGEASLGEAQSSDPPEDPEMIRDRDEEQETGEEEPGEAAEDQDAGPTETAEQVEGDRERDQAEG